MKKKTLNVSQKLNNISLMLIFSTKINLSRRHYRLYFVNSDERFDLSLEGIMSKVS